MVAVSVDNHGRRGEANVALQNTNLKTIQQIDSRLLFGVDHLTKSLGPFIKKRERVISG
jgi:hypothetical protein